MEGETYMKLTSELCNAVLDTYSKKFLNENDGKDMHMHFAQIVLDVLQITFEELDKDNCPSIQ